MIKIDQWKKKVLSNVLAWFKTKSLYINVKNYKNMALKISWMQK